MASPSLETLIRELSGSNDSEGNDRRHHELTTIRLPLDEHSDLTGLMNALESSSSSCNTSIEEINVDIYDTFRYHPDREELLSLFACLSNSLTQLTRLWIDSGGRDDDDGRCPFGTLPVEALAIVLQRAPQLKRLGVFYVELAGDFDPLETAVRDHPSLQAFGVVGSRLAGESTTNPTTIDETTPAFVLTNLMGQSLASLSTLEWVELTGQEFNALGALTPESLGSLCASSTSLTKLTLDQFDLRDPHVIAMASALEHSRTIQELTWTMAELRWSGCFALGQMLHRNASLENVTLQLNGVVRIPAHTTGDNTYDNNHKKKDQDDPILCIAQGLEQNQSIEYFSLCGYATISPSSQEAFATLLRKNTTLVHCSVESENSTTSLPEDLQILSEMYLKLNECGRKELLSDGTTTDDAAPPPKWIDALWKMRHNLNALFYLLSMNPTLCSLQLAGHINCNQCEMFDTLIKYGDHEQKIRL